ncbi:hypothetical protein [Pacificibacter maritimus]|uniref:hypothetical protein n=1 Tax=Pacificibacter maritimus TaxID=762213 RepID=UPI001FE96DA7|nr:hypothetical protein [Pacificibacter maritimus]
MIEFIHGSDVENDADAFRMLVTFDQQNNGKTAVTLRQMHPSAERRAIVVGFGAVEYGAQTWDKFAAFVAKESPPPRPNAGELPDQILQSDIQSAT